MSDNALIKRRLLAVLDHDGIPKHRRAAFLAKAGGISRSTAYRLLDKDARALLRPSAYASIAKEVSVSLDWLLAGQFTSNHMRTWRIHLRTFLGYPPQDTDRIMRMFVANLAGHKKARNLIDLIISGEMSAISAARLL